MQLIYKPFLILASASILLVSCGGNKEEVVDASETGSEVAGLDSQKISNKNRFVKLKKKILIFSETINLIV